MRVAITDIWHTKLTSVEERKGSLYTESPRSKAVLIDTEHRRRISMDEDSSSEA